MFLFLYLLQGCPRDVTSAVKRQRDLLKSRTSAQRSREKRVQKMQEYAEQITALKEQLHEGKRRGTVLRNMDRAKAVPVIENMVDQGCSETVNERAEAFAVPNLFNKNLFLYSHQNQKTITEGIPALAKQYLTIADVFMNKKPNSPSEDESATMNVDGNRTRIISPISTQPPNISDEKDTITNLLRVVNFMSN